MSHTTSVSVREAQRVAVGEALGLGRRSVVIGPVDGEGSRAAPDAPVLEPEVFLRGGAPEADVVIVLDPMPARMILPVAGALGRRAADGVAVLLAVGAGEEALVAPSLPTAAVLRQFAVETVWLGAEASERIAVSTPDPDAAIRVFFVAGGPAQTVEPLLARAAVDVPHHLALEREASELRAANARLRSSHRPIESAAAAALASRPAALEREVARLQERLALEVDVARQNDELFQAARDIIGVREQEIRGLRATLARPQHRAAASAGYHAGRIPLVTRALRRMRRGRS